MLSALTASQAAGLFETEKTPRFVEVEVVLSDEVTKSKEVLHSTKLKCRIHHETTSVDEVETFQRKITEPILHMDIV